MIQIFVIRQKKNKTINLLQLHYTGGLFKTLSHNSFICFGNLRSIIITGSELMLLEPGAFNGLKKLETISLTSNDKLTHIPSNVFNVQSLEIINLSNNSISTIDNEALKIDNSKLSLVNLSHNSLEIIEQGSFRNIKCHFIDLTQSGIIGIVDGAFNTSRINIIDLMKNKILRFNSFKWGINYTITLALLDIITFDIATSSSFNDSLIFRVTYKLNSIHLKESSQCYLSEYGIYKICKTKNKSINSVTDISSFLSIPKLEIQDNEASSIDNYAFKDLKILTLQMISAADKFTISNNSFVGLPSLKVLEIKTKPIQLKTPVFYNLQSLIALEIPMIEPQEFQCQSFSNLQSLEELVLVNYNTVNICYGLCYTINFGIKSLGYKNSTFTKFGSMKLSCLKKLEHLAITNGKLDALTSHSFYGLENIKSLDLSSNQLTHIDRNIFKVLIHLEVLLLNHNKINLIDDKSFENKMIPMLDLSYNELISINKYTFHGLKCKHLDISNNKLLSIENSAFSNMDLDILYIHNNIQVLKNINAWIADEFNMQTDCFDKDPFTICKKFNTLTSVNLMKTRYDYINFKLALKLNVILESQKVELSGQIYSIDRNAFKNSNINTNLNTLIFHQTDHVFTIYPESFEGLKNLENLELNVGAIVLKANLFDKLPSLRYLKIEVEETLQYLSQVLGSLKNLKTLEIVGNDTIGICQNAFSYKIPHSLIDVRYTNGMIKNLQANSMACMPQLEKLIITNTQLMTIQAGTFKSMNNLKYLSLESNKITRIEKGTFENLKCIDLHLSLNNISSIENDSFKNSNIQNIYLFKTGVTLVRKSSGISKSTSIRISTDAEIERQIYLTKLNDLQFK